MTSTKHRPEDVIDKIESAVNSLSTTLEELRASVDTLKKTCTIESSDTEPQGVDHG